MTNWSTDDVVRAMKDVGELRKVLSEATGLRYDTSPEEYGKYLDSLTDECKKLHEQLRQAQEWVNDLQSGMYINCVYCGHRYGPDPGTPVAMADILKEHIGSCPKHPVSALKLQLEQLCQAAQDYLDVQPPFGGASDKPIVKTAERLRECIAQAKEAE